MDSIIIIININIIIIIIICLIGVVFLDQKTACFGR